MALTRKITNSQELQEAIKELEGKVENQQLDIKGNYLQIKDNLRPKKVAKNTFSYLAETPEIQRTFVNTVIGFILGYASKKAVELASVNTLDRTVHNLVNHQLTKLERRQPESWLSRGISLFRKHTPPDSPIYPFIKYRS